jgi:hypothetical protein
MMPALNAAWRFIRKWWWVLVLGACIVGYVLLRIFGPRGQQTDVAVPPKLLEMARDKIEVVHLEGEVEKAKVRTQAEDSHKQIDAIAEKGKTDPKAARKELADYLAANL